VFLDVQAASHLLFYNATLEPQPLRTSFQNAIDRESKA